MPEFDIDKDEYILVKIPSGKAYITQPNHYTNQSKQKGNDCWYYTLNYLRPRYGKKIDAIAQWPIQDADTAELLKEREHERILSAYRKQVKKLDDLIEIHLNKLGKSPILQLMAKHNIPTISTSTIKQIFDLCIKLDSPPGFRNPGFAKKFISEAIAEKEKLREEKSSLNDDYLRNILQQEIDLTEKTVLDLFGHETQKSLIKQAGQITELLSSAQSGLGLEKNSSEYTDPLKVKAGKYSGALKNLCLQRYGVKSKWKPDSKPEEMFHALKTYGSMSVGGRFGRSFYKSDPVELEIKVESEITGAKKEIDQTIKIYHWKPGDFLDEEKSDDLHAILVIGMQKKDGKYFVFYLDPNDDSAAKSTRKIYMISYTSFCARTHTASPQSAFEIGTLKLLSEQLPQTLSAGLGLSDRIHLEEKAQTFAFHPNEDKIKIAQQQYKRVVKNNLAVFLAFIDNLSLSLKFLPDYRNSTTGEFFGIPAKNKKEKNHLLKILKQERKILTTEPKANLRNIAICIIEQINNYRRSLISNAEKGKKSRYLENLEAFLISNNLKKDSDLTWEQLFACFAEPKATVRPMV